MQSIFSSSVGTAWLLVTNTLLGLVLFIVGIQVVIGRFLLRGYRKALIGCLVVLIISFVGWQLYIYFYFHQSSIGRYYLPPHSLYFYQQLGAAMSSVASGLIATAVILVFGLWAVRRQRFTQFGADDWLGLSLGTLAVGWPAVLPFLGLVILLSILGLVAQILIRKKTLADRLIITPYILPAAIVTLIIKAPVLAFTHLDKIRF